MCEGFRYLKVMWNNRGLVGSNPIKVEQILSWMKKFDIIGRWYPTNALSEKNLA